MWYVIEHIEVEGTVLGRVKENISEWWQRKPEGGKGPHEHWGKGTQAEEEQVRKACGKKQLGPSGDCQKGPVTGRVSKADSGTWWACQVAGPGHTELYTPH